MAIGKKGLAEAIKKRDFELIQPFHDELLELWRTYVVVGGMPEAVLAKENKKFMFGMIKTSARAREYDAALLWLNRAGVAMRVNRVSKVAQPLSAYLDQGAFKLFCVDVGLLSCKAGLHPEIIYREEDFEEFKGAMSEQFVFQELSMLPFKQNERITNLPIYATREFCAKPLEAS